MKFVTFCCFVILELIISANQFSLLAFLAFTFMNIVWPFNFMVGYVSCAFSDAFACMSILFHFCRHKFECLDQFLCLYTMHA